MYISEFKAALPYLFKANVVPFVWGVHGIGKTTAMQQFADEGGHKLFTLALGNVEIPDILGIMDAEVDQYTGRKTCASYLKPEFFKDLIDFANNNPDRYAILFLDELNHARKDVLSPVFQMITGGSVHTTKFPANFRIVAASNPPTDDYSGVLNLRNQALLDRFCHIKIDPSSAGWLKYAEGRVNPDMLGFIRENPDHLRVQNTSFSVDQYAKPSERSWEAAHRLYEIGAPKELIYGMVGTSTGTSFYTWMENNRAKTISGDEIFAYSKETQKAVKKLIKEGQWAELQKVVDSFRDTTVKRTAALHEVYEALLKADEAKDTKELERLKKLDPSEGKSTEAETAAVVAFLCDLPDEVMMSAFPQLSTIECRYIAYTVFDDPKMVEHFKALLERVKKGEAKEGKKKK